MRRQMKKTQSNSAVSSFINHRNSLSQEDQIVEAGKIIAEIDHVDVDYAVKKVMQRINKKKTIALMVSRFKNIAAILIIPLLLFSVWNVFNKAISSKTSAVAHQEITSPSGIRTKINLPDGTKVWLNAGSTLTFPVQFVGSERTVDLSGEAFFDVFKNKKSPFVVRSSKARVKVLGTSFNFRSYEAEKNIEVVLREGKVLFESEYGNRKSDMVMQPGTRLVTDKESGEIELTRENINKYIAWHENKLVFDESPIQELALKLERWYGIEVIIDDDQLNNYRFTTTFEGEPLQTVLELLELSSPIEIQYIPAGYDNRNKMSMKSKVIISRK